MVNKNHYMIINGKKVTTQPRRSLDGLSPVVAHNSRSYQRPAQISVVKPAQKKPPVKHPKTPSTNIRPIAKRVPKKASSVHQKQTHSLKRRKPAQNIVFVNTHRRKAADHSNHKLPQSAALTEARLQRAEYHKQSHRITRFGALSDHSFKEFRQKTTKQAHELAANLVEQVIPQAGPPTQARTINQQIANYHTSTSLHSDQPAQNKPTQRLGGIFSSRRLISLSAAAMSFMILVGYAAYLNAPNIAFRVAASRAGIEATMPGYKPSGFALNGPIEYTDGEVTINYKANADQRQFALIQRESDWDSRSLLENYVSQESNRYEVLEDDGLTIYTFNGSEAAWVNRGMMFVIDGESLLDKDQIARLATSL